MNKYLKTQRERNQYINEELRKSRGYRNPDFLQKMVDYFGVDELGTCFSSEIWDPHSLPKEDFKEDLYNEWKLLDQQRRAQKQGEQRVEFVRPASIPDRVQVKLGCSLKHTTCTCQHGLSSICQLPTAGVSGPEYSLQLSGTGEGTGTIHSEKDKVGYSTKHPHTEVRS